MGGRLALDWINREKSLVVGAREGSYDWVERDDPRVAEVRLLGHEKSIGERHGDDVENLLIKGESLHALRALEQTPEYARKYRGKVRLVYIDPPFNTQQTFDSYDDGLEHSVWLTMMRERLSVLRSLLRPDGTIWVHLDSAEVHRCRILLDEIFGPSNYLSTVTWRRTSAKSLAKRTMGAMHEDILIYGASEIAALKPTYSPLDPSYARRFSQSDERGPYDTGDLTAGSHRPHLESGQPWRGFNPSSIKRCWAVPGGPLSDIGIDSARARSMGMLDKLDALDAAGYIKWPEKVGGFPRYKKYLEKAKGVALGDLWTDINVINSQAAERTGFSTQKPEALLKRIIELASDPGDIVLDCFGGSGTTAAVAHKMGRRWVTVEISEQNVESYIAPRLQRIVEGDDLGGITLEVTESPAEILPSGMTSSDFQTAKRVLERMEAAIEDEGVDGSPADTGIESRETSRYKRLVREIDRFSKVKRVERKLWSGGGSFEQLLVEDSCIEVQDGRVFLKDDFKPGQLQKFVNAQLGFENVERDQLVGVRGRVRLAVVDGIVSEQEARAYASQLSDGEVLYLVGRSIEPTAGELLRRLLPGSRTLKAPDALFRKSKVVR